MCSKIVRIGERMDTNGEKLSKNDQKAAENPETLCPCGL